MSKTVTAQTILANRRTGALKTVPTADVEAFTATGDWFVVCREPDELADVQPADADPFFVKPHIRLHHNHPNPYGTPGCPELSPDDFKVLPPAEWQAEDMLAIQRQACHILRVDTVFWTMEQKLDRRNRRIPLKTLLTLAPAIQLPRGEHHHSLEMTFNGPPNAVTLAWLLGQCERFVLKAAIGPQAHEAADPGRLERSMRRSDRAKAGR